MRPSRASSPRSTSIRLTPHRVSRRPDPESSPEYYSASNRPPSRLALCPAAETLGRTSGEYTMSASQPTIRIGIADHDLNKPILDGTVKVEGFDLEIAHG